MTVACPLQGIKIHMIPCQRCRWLASLGFCFWWCHPRMILVGNMTWPHLWRVLIHVTSFIFLSHPWRVKVRAQKSMLWWSEDVGITMIKQTYDPETQFRRSEHSDTSRYIYGISHHRRPRPDQKGWHLPSVTWLSGTYRSGITVLIILACDCRNTWQHLWATIIIIK